MRQSAQQGARAPWKVDQQTCNGASKNNHTQNKSNMTQVLWEGGDIQTNHSLSCIGRKDIAYLLPSPRYSTSDATDWSFHGFADDISCISDAS